MRVVIRKNPDGFGGPRTRAQALLLTPVDMAGPVLRMLGSVHRRQQLRIFATEGAAGGAGRFAALNPKYAARKSRRYPGKKILQLTGDMKDRFTKPTHIGYFQDFVPRGTSGAGVFRFGAYSTVAAAHYHGNPALARLKSRAAQSVFGGLAHRLPVRDMISKTAGMVHEFNVALNEWYKKRVAQAMRRHKPSGRQPLATSWSPR